MCSNSWWHLAFLNSVMKWTPRFFSHCSGYFLGRKVVDVLCVSNFYTVYNHFFQTTCVECLNPPGFRHFYARKFITTKNGGRLLRAEIRDLFGGSRCSWFNSPNEQNIAWSSPPLCRNGDRGAAGAEFVPAASIAPVGSWELIGTSWREETCEKRRWNWREEKWWKDMKTNQNALRIWDELGSLRLLWDLSWSVCKAKATSKYFNLGYQYFA